jgi:archaellum component FlaC
MDAEFIDFLDKKFNRLEAKVDGVQADLNTKFYLLREDISALNERVARIETAMENLTNSVDRIIHMYDELKTEQRMIIADIDRIKVVLHEKLGVEI